MKPALEHLPLNAEESFVARSFDYPYYPTPWHFHPEYEIVLITESSGKRFIGDSISDFKQGDLSFLGPRLPHLYRNDPLYYAPKSRLRAKSIVIHFLESSFGENFLSLPETKKLQSLFHKSRKGLDITGKTAKIVSEALVALLSMEGLARWLKLLEILNIIAESKDCRYISGSVIDGYNNNDSERLNTVFEFVIKNYNRDIQISEVANMINMAENSFSRYFSQRTRKTFTTFVNELRLNNACKLLIENKLSISQICFECGYNNLSNFNRQFRKAYNNNPFNYRKQYLLKYDK
jgi:AraC-like DNA-binding protein